MLTHHDTELNGLTGVQARRKPDPLYLFRNLHSDTESANLQMQKIREISMLSFSLITNAMHALLVRREGNSCTIPYAASAAISSQALDTQKVPKEKNFMGVHSQSTVSYIHLWTRVLC